MIEEIDKPINYRLQIKMIHWPEEKNHSYKWINTNEIPC